MKSSNALVGAVIGVSRSDRGYTVELEGNVSARIDAADDRARGLAGVLEQLQKERRPAYLEVDPETGAITRVRVPVVVRVQEILVDDASGDVRVRLQRSHALPGIKRGSADYDEVLGALREAKAKGDWVALTADGPEIIDIRPYKPPWDEPPRFIDELPRPRLKWWEIKLWPWNWFRCVSKTRAQQLFDLCAAQSCNPLTVPVPCIPFMYPEDGCWARASEMCRLMILDGAHPRKVWIDGYLNAKSKNTPACEVWWGWHVAPTLCVRKWTWFFFLTQTHVIDPSLFTTPVTVATWKSVQNDPSATLTYTAHTYYASWHPSDPTYTETNSDLAFYRTVLQARALGPDGPPPYAHCP